LAVYMILGCEDCDYHAVRRTEDGDHEGCL